MYDPGQPPRRGVAGAHFCWKTAAAGSNAKEISLETNNRVGCDLCSVAGRFDSGAGSARTAETRTRSEAARVFCGQLERGG